MQFISVKKKRYGVHLWIRQGMTTRNEILASLGIIMYIGLILKSNYKSYWDTTPPSQSTPWFPEHFSRERLELLLKFLHFADNSLMLDKDDPSYNKLYKLNPLIEHFQHKIKQYYHPSREISMDESMIGFRGKTPQLWKYMINKHHGGGGLYS